MQVRAGRAQAVASTAAMVAMVVGALAVAAAPPADADQNDAPTRTAFRGLSAGNAMSCAITGAGVLKCWGQNNADGALGQGDSSNRGDQAGEMGDTLTAVPLGTGRSAVAVSSAGDHSCVLLDNASVKCFGWNGGGQLGLGDGSARGDQPGELGDALPAVDLGTGRTAVAVSANGSQSCAILDNAQLKCWGDNLFGQLGQGDGVRRGDNAGEMGDALLPVNLGTGRTATAVATGRSHTCAILDNGSVKCWGWNQFGQLGLGDTSNRGGGAGQMGDALPAVALGTGRTAVAISAGFITTCALLDNGQVKCWGNNNSGQLGLGDTDTRGDGLGEMGDALPAVALGTGRTAVAISVADTGPCALLDNGRVKCWGANTAGQLGQGDTDNRGDGLGEMGDALLPIDLGTGRTAVAITGGNVHNCARLDDDSVKCWGDNNAGALGLGDTAARGDGPGEMGDALPAVAVVTPAPAMTASLAASPASVPVGATVDVSLSVQNTGNVGLTGFSVTPSSLSCPSLPSAVLPGASTVIACTYLTTVDDVGSLALSASVDTAQTSPVATNSQNVTVVDETDPSVTITTPVDGATFDRGAVVNADFSCADDVALDTCVGDVADGSPIDTSTLGAQEFSVTATDVAGNSVTVTHDYTVVDGTDPSVTITTPADGASLAQGAVVNADFACADEVGGSGLASCVGPVADGSPIDTSTLGPHTFSVTATDSSANTATVTHNYTVVPPNAPVGDRTAPTVRIITPPVGATYYRTQVILAEYGCADEVGGSGLSTCVGDVPFGSPIDTSTPGEHTLSITATDAAGNRVKVTRTYTVVEAECLGRTVTVYLGLGDTPTNRGDVLLGTQGTDTLVGLGGVDRVCGRGGPDTIRGGPGPDRIQGGAGGDALLGGGGPDVLRGGPGDDEIVGGPGHDTAWGGPGTDTCLLAPGRDVRHACENR